MTSLIRKVAQIEISVMWLSHVVYTASFKKVCYDKYDKVDVVNNFFKCLVYMYSNFCLYLVQFPCGEKFLRVNIGYLQRRLIIVNQGIWVILLIGLTYLQRILSRFQVNI
uniref:Uncharacterized protein n=1 Tax=Rhizophagus irregularis (strain DAOM 181602 / DAOM 197198 / MUCL 43194) TaxID=747089 RepID=U9U2J3_RHIID